MPVQFKYPETGWSTGRMRKAAMRSGKPELEEPGIAEAEKLAGASRALSARGGITPAGRVEGAMASPLDLLTQHKEQINDAAGQYAKGKMSLVDFNQFVTDLGWTPSKKKNGQLQVTDPNGTIHSLGEE